MPGFDSVVRAEHPDHGRPLVREVIPHSVDGKPKFQLKVQCSLKQKTEDFVFTHS